jgi:sulfate adenylyltransferase
LGGFLDQGDYLQVLENMHLADGAVWPMPICLDISYELATTLRPGQRVALNDQEGFLLAILTVSEIWRPEKDMRRRWVTAPRILTCIRA